MDRHIARCLCLLALTGCAQSGAPRVSAEQYFVGKSLDSAASYFGRTPRAGTFLKDGNRTVIFESKRDGVLCEYKFTINPGGSIVAVNYNAASQCGQGF